VSRQLRVWVRAAALLLVLAPALWAAEAPAAAPRQRWRLGFSDGGRRFLEVPPTDELCEEKERLLAVAVGGSCAPETPDREPVVLPRAQALALQRAGLAERPSWWVLDLDGTLTRQDFPHLVGLYAEAGVAGCYYLASDAAAKDRSPVEGPADEGLFFVFPDRPSSAPPVRRPTADWQLFDRAEGRLPARYVDALKGPEGRRALGAHYGVFAAELYQVFAQPFSARVDPRGRPVALWLVGWVASGPKSGELDTAWAVCREQGSRLKPLAVIYDATGDYAGKYRAEVVAAVDLDNDGADELVLSASYGEGSGYKVFTWKAGSLVQAYDAAYFGE
jgi:hypothetical protein